MKEIFIVTKEHIGKRLDVFLNDVTTDITRSQIKKSIDEGRTLVNGASSKGGKALKEGDEVEFEEITIDLNASP